MSITPFLQHGPRGLLLATAVVFSLSAQAGPAADVECAMCHDEPVLPASHMPVDEMSVEACGMCHEASADDPYFRTIHEVHGEELGCDTCHSDSSVETKARLREMLGL